MANKRGIPVGITHADIFARWMNVREEYFESVLMGKQLTLKQLADKHNLSHQAVRNKSSKENWPQMIEKLKADREQLVAEKLTERTSLALDELNQTFATNEVEIRKRHAMMARGLQVRAVKRLKELPLDAFSPRDALAMLKLGMEEERFALGMQQVAPATPEGSASHPEYKSVADQIGGHKKVQSIGMMLLKAIREQSDNISDVNIEGVVEEIVTSDADDVGLGSGS